MLQRKLAAFAERLGDVRLLALIDQDGIPIANVSFDAALDLDLDLDRMTAELASLARDIVADYHGMAVGRSRQFSVLFGQTLMMLSFVSRDYSLLLVADDKVGQGRARFELRRAGLTLEQDLA